MNYNSKIKLLGAPAWMNDYRTSNGTYDLKQLATSIQNNDISQSQFNKSSTNLKDPNHIKQAENRKKNRN